MRRPRTQGSGFPTLPDQSKVKRAACEPEIVSSSVSKPGKYRGPLLLGKNRPFHLDRENSGKAEGEKSGVQKKK